MRTEQMTLVVSVVIGVALAAFAAQQWTERKELERRAAELNSKAEQLEQQVAEQRATEQARRAEEAAERETRLAKLHEAEQAPTPVAPLPDRPTCMDSDATHGRDAIYIRGSVAVRSGGPSSQRSDHCRNGQLVEFSCVENPPGSGFFIEDYQIIDCPAGSRCVSGECLR